MSVHYFDLAARGAQQYRDAVIRQAPAPDRSGVKGPSAGMGERSGTSNESRSPDGDGHAESANRDPLRRPWSRGDAVKFGVTQSAQSTGAGSEPADSLSSTLRMNAAAAQIAPYLRDWLLPDASDWNSPKTNLAHRQWPTPEPRPTAFDVRANLAAIRIAQALRAYAVPEAPSWDSPNTSMTTKHAWIDIAKEVVRDFPYPTCSYCGNRMDAGEDFCSRACAIAAEGGV